MMYGILNPKPLFHIVTQVLIHLLAKLFFCGQSHFFCGQNHFFCGHGHFFCGHGHLWARSKRPCRPYDLAHRFFMTLRQFIMTFEDCGHGHFFCGQNHFSVGKATKSVGRVNFFVGNHFSLGKVICGPGHCGQGRLEP